MCSHRKTKYPLKRLISAFFILIGRGAPAGAGGAAAPRVAFLRKKLRKNLLGKRFFGGQWGKCEHRPPIPEGARPVFAEGKDRLAVGASFLGPIFLGWDDARLFEMLSNFDLSV